MQQSLAIISRLNWIFDLCTGMELSLELPWPKYDPNLGQENKKSVWDEVNGPIHAWFSGEFLQGSVPNCQISPLNFLRTEFRFLRTVSGQTDPIYPFESQDFYFRWSENSVTEIRKAASIPLIFNHRYPTRQGEKTLVFQRGFSD